MKFKKSLIAVLVSSALLSACGSGGSGSGTSPMPSVNVNPNTGVRPVPEMNGKFKNSATFPKTPMLTAPLPMALVQLFCCPTPVLIPM